MYFLRNVFFSPAYFTDITIQSVCSSSVYVIGKAFLVNSRLLVVSFLRSRKLRPDFQPQRGCGLGSSVPLTPLCIVQGSTVFDSVSVEEAREPGSGNSVSVCQASP